MRNNSYKLNIYYEYNIQEANNPMILSKYTFKLIMFGHFKKSASILTDQDTQMVGNDWWWATICNAAGMSLITVREFFCRILVETFNYSPWLYIVWFVFSF